MTGRLDIRAMLDWLSHATPAELAEFNAWYDALYARLKKRFPNEAAVRRAQAREIIERAQCHSRRTS